MEQERRPHYGETFAAANRRDPKAIPDLILYAGNELFPLMVRATAVSLLANYDDTLSRRAIEKSLSDPYSLVRHSAINGFNPEDIKSFEKLMMPLLNDPVKGIRIEAAIRLSTVPEDQLSDPVRKARKSCASGIYGCQSLCFRLSRGKIQSRNYVCQCR